MKEQFVPVDPNASIVQALARGVCPICTLMRSLQNAMVENAHNFRKWVTQYETVCLFHGRRRIEILPEMEAHLIRNILASNQDDLEKQLAGFEIRIKRGETGGGGVLGHIAEFLVSQRGLTR